MVTVLMKNKQFFWGDLVQIGSDLTLLMVCTLYKLI